MSAPKGCKFVAFEQDPGVCDTCGELADTHAMNIEYTPYREALWRTLIRHGGIPDFYMGDVHFQKTMALRNHFGMLTAEEIAYANSQTWEKFHIQAPARPCRIDWKNTQDPVMDSVGHFQDSDCEAARIEAVVGHLRCGCNEYIYEGVALLRKTLGQLIWLVVRSGEMPEGL